jgi:hypothetical protein
MAAGNDRRLAQASYAPPVGTRLLNGYLDRLQITARSDPKVAWAFLRVGSLLAPPASLLHPAIAWRVARDTLRWKQPQPKLVAQGNA